MPDLATVRRNALRSLIPPPRIALSQWAEQNIHLPSDISALPGKMRMWPYMREICDAIGSPEVERVTLVKSARCGFTTLLVAAIGSFCANEPCPVLCVLPVEADCRDFVVTDIEGVFKASPTLHGLLSGDCGDEGERNTLCHRKFPGGSLRVVAARAPRNLRRVAARILLCDEVDAMEVTAEGNPIRLAERRTLTFSNRKIVIGSTPVFEETSAVLASYAASDMRVFECPCPACGAFTEIQWGHIEWPAGEPERAAFRCPHCAELIEERHKAAMVAAGRWRATNSRELLSSQDNTTSSREETTSSREEVSRHAGFRLNALVSLLANASWSRLAAEFVAAKESPEELQVFVNTVLAQGWSAPGIEIDESALASRAEPFDLQNIPPEVLIITAGADLQDDRIECSIVGWTRQQEALVLGHVVIWGPPAPDETSWIELDELLRSRFKHPYGGMLGIDATIVDSSAYTEAAYSFCFPRLSRRIWAGKGMAGTRPALAVAKLKAKSQHGGRLFLVGVDTIKSTIFNRLQHGRSIRFSRSLEPVYYEQLTSERRVIRYVRGRPVRRFERKTSHARAEALDALVYNFAARSGLTIPLDAREDQLRNPEASAPPPAVFRSRFMEKHRAGR
jgi:phage terminase large subunit GpA-like protein